MKQISKDSRRVHPINRKTPGQIIREEIVRGFQEQDRQELERTRLKVAHQARAHAHARAHACTHAPCKLAGRPASW